MRRDPKGESWAVSLEFKRKTEKQVDRKSWQLPQKRAIELRKKKKTNEACGVNWDLMEIKHMAGQQSHSGEKDWNPNC